MPNPCGSSLDTTEILLLSVFNKCPNFLRMFLIKIYWQPHPDQLCDSVWRQNFEVLDMFACGLTTCLTHIMSTKIMSRKGLLNNQLHFASMTRNKDAKEWNGKRTELTFEENLSDPKANETPGINILPFPKTSIRKKFMTSWLLGESLSETDTHWARVVMVQHCTWRWKSAESMEELL